jgi:dihydroorotate dehydrogenase electron transfer subunit
MLEDHRNPLYVEDALVLGQHEFAAQQYVLRLHAPRIAASAAPGMFIHLRCDELLPMRRPMSIMRSDASAGWLEVLYKVIGTGTSLLASKGAQARLNLVGPIGRPFEISPAHPQALLIGGGTGIPPMVFLAERLRNRDDRPSPVVIMGSEVPFPFETRNSRLPLAGIPPTTTSGMALLEHWGITSRLASRQGYPGCFEGLVTELARCWLLALTPDTRQQVQICACGPTAMLKTVAELATDYRLPCQVALEEYMACAVGGCAGCTVLVNTPSGRAMKRVCVDGPVFDAASLVWGSA